MGLDALWQTRESLALLPGHGDLPVPVLDPARHLYLPRAVRSQRDSGTRQRVLARCDGALRTRRLLRTVAHVFHGARAGGLARDDVVEGPSLGHRSRVIS